MGERFMIVNKLYGSLAQIFGAEPDLQRSGFLQSATVLGLALLIAGIDPSRAAAQATGRVEVRAMVVDVTASRSAVASLRWLLGQKRDLRKERGLATIEVSRKKRQVAINYLKN